MKKIVKDNKGIALITVVIGVMFCLLLTSTMLRVSLLGMQSRSINNQTSDTFYDAEGVVDTIRLNLQNTAAKAWKETTNETNSLQFVSRTFFLLTGKNYPTSGSITLSASEKQTTINNLQQNALVGGSVKSIGEIVRFNGETGNLEGITIKDVEVEYRNPTSGMVSYVKTDLTIRAPLYASKKKFPLASYSMFAGSGAGIWNAQGPPGGQYSNPNQFGFLEQEGNVYFGYETWHDAKNAEALTLVNRETLILSGENVVINGDVICTTYSNLMLTGTDVEIRGKIILGKNCHLVIGTNTNLRCQDIWFVDNDSSAKWNYNGSNKMSGTYSFTNSRTYPGSPYKCYQSFKGLDIAGFGNSGAAAYVNNSASIVYIDGAHVDTANAYDAKIVNHKAYTKEGAALSIHIDENVDTANSDTELHPKPRRKTQNEDGTGTTYGAFYDAFFIEMVDVEYFEGFMNDCNSITQNAKCDHRIKSSEYNPNRAKNEPTNASAFESSGLSNRKVAYENVSLNGTQNPTFTIYFTGSQTTGNGNIVNVSERPFVLSNHDVELNQDSMTANYCGIVITSKKVTFKKDNGFCSGKSLLLLDPSPQLTNLKKFMDTVGALVASTDVGASKWKYVVFNNLFNDGMKRFYSMPNSGNGSNFTIDTEHNSIMDLTDTSNYEKH